MLALFPALLVFFLLTVVGAIWARWLSSETLEFAPIWPPAGLAIAAAAFRPTLLLAVGAGLFVWVWQIQGGSPEFATANLLILSGPLMYAIIRASQREDRRQTVRVKDLFHRYRLVMFWAVIPSSVIGTVLYAESFALKPLSDTLLIYLISESAGVAIFAPAAGALLGPRKEAAELLRPSSLANLMLVLLVTLLPLFFESIGQPEYAEGVFLLMFPLVGWIALQNQQALMAVSMVMIAVIQLMLEMLGVGIDGSSFVFEFVERVIWLLAAFVLGNALLTISLERLSTLEQARWQATHNENLGWLNERGLQEQMGDLPETDYDLIMAQVCGRDLLMASLSYTELRDTERELGITLKSLQGWQARARLSDLTFGFLVESRQPISLDSRTLQTLALRKMDITIKLAWSRVPIDGGNTDRALVEGYAGLQRALEQPMNRVQTRSRDETPLAGEETPFTHYQQVMSALEGGGLRLWGQAIQSINDGKPSIELLSRLDSGSGELISPNVFLGALSAFDELETLDMAVLGLAVSQEGPIRRLLPDFGRININLSGSTLCDPWFISWLDDLWPEDIPRHCICFELTESELIRNLGIARQVFAELRLRGFQTAIDDFGSGLASYEYLENFPADLIKLDGLFVRDLTDNPVHQSMVKATVLIAQSLGAKVCAEFVENRMTADFLAREGVNYLQGYYLAKPMPIDEHFSPFANRVDGSVL